MADTTLSFNVLAKDNASSTITKVGQKFGALHLGVGKVTQGLAAVGPALAGLAVGAGLTQFVNDARESARIGRITAQVIKTTGGAAKITADQVGDLATAISNKTGADDEAIQSGQNMLLTFTNIRNGVGKGNDIFNQASQAITDMTAAMNNGEVTAEGMKTSSIQLGKALNDPIKGVSALRKVGVAFTADQQKQIKALVESGRTMEAQKIILAELGKEFGGAAEAAGDPITKLKTIVGNASETIGGALLPIVNKGANLLGKIVPAAISKASTGIHALGAAFREGDVTSDGFVGVMERIGVVARGAFGIFKTQVLPRLREFGGFITGSVVPGVKNLVATFAPLAVELKDKLVSAFGLLVPNVVALGETVSSKVGPAIRGFTGFLKNHGTIVRSVAVGVGAIVGAMLLYKGALGVVSVATKAYAAVQAALNVVMSLNPIGVIVLALVGLAAGLVYAYKHSEKFRAVVDKLGGAMKTAFTAVVGFVKDTIKFFKDLPGNVRTAIGDAAKALVQKGKDFINGLLSGIWEVAKGIDKWMTRAPVAKLLAPWYGAGKWLLQKGKDFIQGLISGIWDKAKGLNDWISRNVTNPAIRIFLNSGKWLLQKGKDFIMGYVNGALAYLRGIKGIGAWMYNNVAAPGLRTFANAGTWLVQKGRDLIGGMLSGITDKMKNIAGWIKPNVVDPIINAVKKFFGIASPSKVFAEIGGHLIGGLFKGMGSNVGSAIAKRVFGDMPSALRALVGKGLVPLSNLPGKALNALTGLGADFQVPADVAAGVLGGPNRRVFYQGEAFDLSTYRKLANAMKMVGAINVTQGGYERASSYSGSTHTGGGVFDVVGGNLPRILAALKASGLIGWIRNPSQGPWPWHIHALDPSDIGRMSASARGQVTSYYEGGSGLAGYKQGTPWVPNDQWAYLHEGEGVLPRKVNEARLRAGSGGAGVCIHLDGVFVGGSAAQFEDILVHAYDNAKRKGRLP